MRLVVRQVSDGHEEPPGRRTAFEASPNWAAPGAQRLRNAKLILSLLMVTVQNGRSAAPRPAPVVQVEASDVAHDRQFRGLRRSWIS